MRNRRRRSKPLGQIQSQELFEKLPDHLQKALKKALGGSEDSHFSSLLKPPAETPSPPVLFSKIYGFKEFIERADLKTLIALAADRRRWYGMSGECRERIRERLGWTYENVHRIQDGPYVTGWTGTLDEWMASFGVRTDPPEPGDTQTSSGASSRQ